jgi:hypothetical protein
VINDSRAAELERRIATIWSDVLETDQVSGGDSFVGLGGDVESASCCTSEREAAFDVRVPLFAISSGDPWRVIATLLERAAVYLDSDFIAPCSLFFHAAECQH